MTAHHCRRHRGNSWTYSPASMTTPPRPLTPTITPDEIQTVLETDRPELIEEWMTEHTTLPDAAGDRESRRTPSGPGNATSRTPHVGLRRCEDRELHRGLDPPSDLDGDARRPVQREHVRPGPGRRTLERNTAALRLVLDLADEQPRPPPRARGPRRLARLGIVPRRLRQTPRPHRHRTGRARPDRRRAEQRWPGYLATARRTTLNAHYTDPAIIAAVCWQFLRAVGADDHHVGWEPGAGTGLWMSDPAATVMHGVELDPVSAAIGNSPHPRPQPHRPRQPHRRDAAP